MLPEQRKRRLLELLSARGWADVSQLADELRVSAATVRRDLQFLEGHGHIKRTHGGAVLPHVSTAFEPVLVEKSGQNRKEKEAVAREAAKLVSNGEVVVLDSGSTILALAQELKRKRDLTVITNDLKIALELCDAPGFNVIVLGGKVRPSLYSVTGPSVEEALGRFNANHSFLGADGINLDAGLTNASLEEAPIKTLMIRCGQRATLLADHSKFGKASLVKVCDLTEFDLVLTDDGLESKVAKRYLEAGVNLSLVAKERTSEAVQ
jgi:DeoR family fructose operon transcriptional repressor